MYPLPLFAYSASSAFYGFLFDYYITCTRSYTVLQSENRLCPIPPQLPSLRSKHFNSFDIQIYTSIYIRQTPRPVAIPPGSPRSDTNHNRESEGYFRPHSNLGHLSGRKRFRQAVFVREVVQRSNEPTSACQFRASRRPSMYCFHFSATVQRLPR